MPQDRKTTINNLIIVWQGQSWSIIAPNAIVLARFTKKLDAIRYAKTNTDYISNSVNDYLDDDFIEFREYVYRNSTSHRKSKNIPIDSTDETKTRLMSSIHWLAGVILIAVLVILTFRLIVWIDYRKIVENIGLFVNNINWVGISLLGLIIIAIIALLRWVGDYLAMLGTICILVICLALCNFIGILPWFLNWVF